MSRKAIQLFFHLFILIYSFNACTHNRKPIYQKSKHVAPTPAVTLRDEITSDMAANSNDHYLAEVDESNEQIEKALGEQIDLEQSSVIPSKNSRFLKNVNTKRVQFWVDYFTKKERARFQRFINNGENYREDIENILAQKGVPKELYYVGLIESGYNLGARSHASAVGPWQFVKGTGLRYGMRINHEIDERRDLFKATAAAAEYFKDLNNIFMSWELALAAYNAGEYGMIRRITKHKTRDFYELSRKGYLPSETMNYVPKVLAAKHVVENAEKYGFNIPKNTRFFKDTKLMVVNKNMSLNQIARKLNTSDNLLSKLNPELLSNKTPRFMRGSYTLRVPNRNYSNFVVEPESNYSEKLLSNISKLKTKKQKKQIVKVKKQVQNPIVYKIGYGDTLESLSDIFDVSVTKIIKHNKMKKNKKIRIGQKIVLPNTKRGIYTVRRGDHLIKIAQKYNLNKIALIKLNALKKNKIYPGQKLIVNLE
jgi:membrane-bound lytic murein transglycosylase D